MTTPVASSSNVVIVPILMLDNTDVLANIISYLDLSDILPLLLLCSKKLQEPLNNAISSSFLLLSTQQQTTTTLNFSYLLKKFPNRLSSSSNKDKRAEAAICQLLSMLPNSKSNETTTTAAAATTTVVRRRRQVIVECSHLRNITGQIWLNELLLSKLNNNNNNNAIVSLNLAGCNNIMPIYLNEFLRNEECSKNLKTLSLLNCNKVGKETCDIICEHHTQLTSLCLGGCSQRTITDINISKLLLNLNKLQYLDLQGLKNITGYYKTTTTTMEEEAVGIPRIRRYFLEDLPTTIKSLQLCACESFSLLGETYWPRELILQTYNNNNATNNNNNNNIDLLLQSLLEEESEELDDPKKKFRHNHLTRIYLDGVGSPRRGLSKGMIAYFALCSRNLQEVSFSGCEQIQDWEIVILAKNCSHTLKEFSCVGTSIGDMALQSLGQYCGNTLIEVDVSACFRITDRGIIDLCNSNNNARRLQQQHVASASAESSDEEEEEEQQQQRYEGQPKNDDDDGNNDNSNNNGNGGCENANKRRKISSSSSSSLRVLKMSYNDELTDFAIYSGISKLQNLHMLDVRECPNITASALCYNITMHLPNLIDINAKGIADIGGRGKSLPSLLRNFVPPPNNNNNNNNNNTAKVPVGLRYINQRSFVPPPQQQQQSSSSCGCGSSSSICSVRTYSQRLTPSVPMNTMIHCIDCGLTPELDRGICQSCASTCHKGHNTIVGSWVRFYCDCPFSVLSTNNGTNNHQQQDQQSEQLSYCQAIFPSS